VFVVAVGLQMAQILVAHLLGPDRNVVAGAGVVGENLQGLPDLDLADPFFGLQKRSRAGAAPGVDGAGCGYGIEMDVRHDVLLVDGLAEWGVSFVLALKDKHKPCHRRGVAINTLKIREL